MIMGGINATPSINTIRVPNVPVMALAIPAETASLTPLTVEFTPTFSSLEKKLMSMPYIVARRMVNGARPPLTDANRIPEINPIDIGPINPKTINPIHSRKLSTRIEKNLSYGAGARIFSTRITELNKATRATL